MASPNESLESNQLPEHVRLNREVWNKQAANYASAGEKAWSQDKPTWGIWGIRESQVGLLPDDLAGKDTIELGCGTAYVSSWLARRGARAVGVDISAAQLATANRLRQKHGVPVAIVRASAETVPCRDSSFDLAISEYGACLWADPEQWVPEAARLLRPGGQLIFLINSFLMTLCTREDNTPNTDQLRRSAFGVYRIEWPGDPGVEFHLSHGDWIRLLRRSGFEVKDLIELRPSEGSTTRYPYVTLEWARKWPCEEVWKARKRR
jgi:SAM-dependent methyltransferase